MAPAETRPDPRLVNAIRTAARPLAGRPDDHDDLLKLVGDARVVLLGEASHGSTEFYRERAAITRRLIADCGFDAVAIEGDWPDAFRVNRHVRGLGRDRDARESLAAFRRFPTWMWRNHEVAPFIDWLRAHNEQRPPPARVGFYGLDLYSLHASMAAVLDYLDRTDPDAAVRVRERYACFDHHGDELQRYGLLAAFGSAPSCEQQVLQNLVELQRHAHERSRRAETAGDREAAFDAEQNARLVANAEAYYRAMVSTGDSSWNLRDTHMAQTLRQLERHLAHEDGRPARIVVWAHNSHVGDARASEMGRGGELSLGQLVRERLGRDAVLVGFSTHDGTVTAADNWDSPAQTQRVLPARPDSHEALLHATGIERFMLPLRDLPEPLRRLDEVRLERAIGVIYRPQTERQSHYFESRLARRFDAIIHIGTTSAIRALETTLGDDAFADGEAPETFPSGM